MYVCVCNAITEGQIKTAIGNGADTLSRLRDELEVATCCGTCAERVEHCLQDVLEDALNGATAPEMPFSDLASV